MRQNQLAVSLRPDFFSGTGNKEAVARRKLHFFILLVQDSAALDTYKTAEGIRIGRQLCRTVNLIACAFKIFASAQDPAGISILHNRLILELRQLVSMIIHDFQRLFHMQLAAVTVTVGTVIVVQTIGTV